MFPSKLDRLKEKVFSGKDSKLYIPLSDEYKKQNMIDDAVKVLKYCIKKYPAYMSARVALGKIYMEKGFYVNAIEEFEIVAAATPACILAHRKLAELYKAIGYNQKAMATYQAILSLNLSDAEAMAGIAEITGQQKPSEQIDALPEAQDFDETESLEDNVSLKDSETLPDTEKLKATESFDDTETITVPPDVATESEPFSVITEAASLEEYPPLKPTDKEEPPLDSDIGDGDGIVELKAEPLDDEAHPDSHEEIDTDGLLEKLNADLVDQQPDTEHLNDITEMFSQITKQDQETEPSVFEAISDVEALSYDTEVEALSFETEIPDSDTMPFIKGLDMLRPETDTHYPEAISDTIIEQPQYRAESIDKRSWLSQELEMVENYIITEHYIAAIKAFNRLLDQYPGDKEIINRLDEIRHFAKLMDKDENTMIRRLSHIKDKLKERREEYAAGRDW